MLLMNIISIFIINYYNYFIINMLLTSNDLIKLSVGGGDKKSKFNILSIPIAFNCNTTVLKFVLL